MTPRDMRLRNVSGILAVLLTLATLEALVLLALPVIAGVLTARAVSRRPGAARALKILVVVVPLGMAVVCIISVIYVHGTF